jgi:thiamine pyrophosphokinase
LSTGIRHALILADGDAPDRTALDVAWPGWSDGIDLIVAADGGARYAADLGLGAIDLWVGDGDSLTAGALDDLRRAGVPIELAESAKDESDTELAVMAAVDRGAKRLTVLGAFGGPRLDHALANTLLLGHPRLVDRSVVLLAPAARVRLVGSLNRGSGPIELVGRPGDLVSLLPFGAAVSGVSTSGLLYPLVDEPLSVGPARGLSNVQVGQTASVSLRAGRLLIVETPVTLSR